MKSNLTPDDKNKIGVYLLQNPNTLETYVGSGNLSDREYNHFRKLEAGRVGKLSKDGNSIKHDNWKLQKAYNKDNNFDFIASLPIEIGTVEENRMEALAIEQDIINTFKNNPLFLNIAEDATSGMHGRKHSEEAKSKISNANKGKVISEETKEKQRQALLGRKHSDETKEKISQAGKGRIPSETARLNMVNAQKERRANTIVSDETREKCRIANLNNTNACGAIRSEETRKKLSIAHTGKKISLEQIEKLRQANLGKTLSKETKEKISVASAGRKHTPETKEKCRQAAKKAWENEEHRNRVVAGNILAKRKK